MVIKNLTTHCVCCHTTLWNTNVRKQAINDKLLGSAATLLRYGGIVKNQIKNCLLLSLSVIFLNRWIFGKVTSKKVVVSCTLHAWPPQRWKTKKVHETITLLLVTLPNIHKFQKIFTDRLSYKPFLIWLLTTPPHLKHVATLPCNLSLMACILTIKFHKVVWQHIQGVMGFLITTLLQMY